MKNMEKEDESQKHIYEREEIRNIKKSPDNMVEYKNILQKI